MITEQPQSSWIINWLKESITVKLAFIAVLTLLLLIPSFMVENLINERAQRQTETINSIADQWSGSQLIQGPVLVIPYKRSIKEINENKETSREVTERLFILPEQLNMAASLDTKVLYRGIYQATVYSTRVKINGSFSRADLAKAGLTPEQLIWNKAKITFSITDLKGLQTNPEIIAGDKHALAEPALNDKGLFSDGLQCAFDLSEYKDRVIPFSFALDLKGSDELHFLPLGKTTNVEASGNWSSPSFDGRYIPNERKVTETGFDAKWKMLYYNRPFPQQWTADDTLLNSMQKHQDAIFGVKLRLPVDEYQKTIRTSKYAILIVLLTFISLFLTELIGKKKIHSFNYILIGAAMIIYYVLLLSFCEQVGYNIAYAIASVATVGLITAFIASLLNNKKAAIIFSIILSVFYTFIFVIIQLEDLALLVGSIALFVIIALLMYFSRKINWDKY